MLKILITDGRYSHTLGIIRSLNKLGHKVDCIGHPLCLSSFSKSTNQCSYRQSLFNEPNIYRFLEFLENSKYDFLIPVGAKSVDLVNKFRRKKEKKTNINLAPKKSIDICLNKKQLLSIAEEIGIPIPKTYNKNKLRKIISSGEDPNSKLVVKPSSELSDEKVIYISRKDLKRSTYLDSDNFLIQEYIQGSGFGFFAIYENGNLKEFFMHKRIRENPITGGSSVCAKSIYEPKLFRYGKDLLDKLNWHGVAMVEFKKDSKSGKYYLMEVNPKFWASHDLAIACGVNFAEKYIEISSKEKKKLNKNIVNKPNYKINHNFQWLARDIKTNLLRPKRLLQVFYYLIYLKASNNLYIKDPMPSLYLIIYAFFSPLLKLSFFRKLYSFIYRIKSVGFKTAFIRTYSEVLGLPILKYSLINKNLALGAQPSSLGLNFLSKKGFKYLLNLRSEFNYDDYITTNFRLKYIPVKEYFSPTLEELNDGAEYINYVISKNSKIYVHCREGISRAACFVAAYLIKYKGLNYEKAISEIKKRRYFIKVLNNQIILLKEFEKKFGI